MQGLLSLYSSLKKGAFCQFIMLVRWSKLDNWGDALNPVLIECVSGESPIWVKKPRRRQITYKEPVYVVIGSIIAKASDKNAVIWGAGFKSANEMVRWRPKKVCAVRGPLSRSKLHEQGIECPDIYGDPALLYPKFYKPVINKKYELGIIPHYVDKDNAVLDKLKDIPEVRIIDVTIGINRFIDEICSCEKIASSSLHGIIAADAYGIPSIWLKFSDKIVGSGFKFMDYFLSVKRPYQEPLVMNEYTTLNDILKTFYPYEIDIDLNRLFDACPFRK